MLLEAFCLKKILLKKYIVIGVVLTIIKDKDKDKDKDGDKDKDKDDNRLGKSPWSNIEIRERFQKTKWKFEMAFAIKHRTTTIYCIYAVG